MAHSPFRQNSTISYNSIYTPPIGPFLFFQQKFCDVQKTAQKASFAV